ncbi:hypothetical protein EUA06_21350 [Nocardioides glacieisoli]|uniref:Uncharacterized protein n=1 Tax=Nocardioides glacieisoli TaxID=1168730 RepID=A0A4V1RJD6_9ACTN|nr:hypothetical protein [Nocardioides glacieisoli]RYB88412.1 hypothetical protein EUA06_21350 [Nocardioides glacieisoli]
MTRGLEVHLEELGEHSWWRALLTTISGSYGSALYRFVAVPVGEPAEHRAASHALVSSTFPVLRLQDMDDTTEPHAWLPLAQEQLRELDADLAAHGWQRSAETGPHWWSLHYTPS